MGGSGAKEGDGPRVVRPRWDAAIFVCGKCCKRHKDGKALRRALKEGAGGTARVVATSCLKLCPKRAVVVASAASLAAGEVMLLRDEADALRALPRLLPATGPGGVGPAG